MLACLMVEDTRDDKSPLSPAMRTLLREAKRVRNVPIPVIDKNSQIIEIFELLRYSL